MRFGQEGEIYATVTHDMKTGVASSALGATTKKNWTIEGTNSKLLLGV
ncbi:MAG: hypothetical protein P0116_16255 [Candidatus Nitrosocosmicus sp.]|nr:hypothetical protein [Candidatus Nitrosocosmicus sp.]